jgi:hypothetical protein
MKWAAEQNLVLDRESFALLRACREGASVAAALYQLRPLSVIAPQQLFFGGGGGQMGVAANAAQ